MPNRTTVHVIIAGKVQGVGYRAWVERQATSLGLDGWVRNRRNGDVEAVFSGDKSPVDEMVSRCSRGPAMADVSEVRVLATGAPVPLGFSVLPTD
jgi:acylphosphatase